MKKWIERNVPAGIDYGLELRWIGAGLLVSLFYSLRFADSYTMQSASLYIMKGAEKVLRAGAVMTDFVYVLGDSLAGFMILALCMLAVLVWHYAYHYRGSKSIYLMRRLPNRWELIRRCVTLHAVATAACFLAAFVLLLCYYAFYMWVTPEICLKPGQWQKIWPVWMEWRTWMGGRA
ncbi:MAG: hypothetical protein EOM54_04760 [Clostridia bacterium]|nr:hypothetical protein [Clostridia bacterium]